MSGKLDPSYVFAYRLAARTTLEMVRLGYQKAGSAFVADPIGTIEEVLEIVEKAVEEAEPE